jgi:hypothetical protein
VTVLSGLMTRLEREPEAGPLDHLTQAERRAIIRGERLPRPRRPIVRPDGPSVIPGRTGLSREAVHLFSRAQEAGGPLSLASMTDWARLADLDALCDELVHFELVERIEVAPHRRRPRSGGPAILVCAGYEDAIVPSTWNRWA